MTTTAMRDITPPPPIPTIARKGSHPSLTHSSTGTSDDHHHSPLELVTPVNGAMALNQEVAIRKASGESREDVSSGDEVSTSRGRTLKGRFGTRSMSNIKSKPAASISPAPPVPQINRPGAGRERAMTLAAPAVPPSPVRKPAKQGGFSSFIRKLTGKQPKKPAVASPMDVLSRPDPPFRPVHIPDPPTSRKPALPPLDLNRLPPGAAPAGPQTAPAGTLHRNPLSAYPVMEPTSALPAQPETEEPTEIPLPPSPIKSPVSETSEFGTRPEQPAVPSRSTKRTKQLVSMPEFEIEEELADSEEDEVADMVKPLAPLRIPSSSASATSPIPVSATSTTSNRTSVLSPSVPKDPFAEDSSPEKEGRQAPPSPRRAPAPQPSLDRNGSKWRKPIGVDRRASQRPTPASQTSYDSYTSTSYRGPPPAGSARRAANRTSCAPTMHSTASVAASLRAIQNKAEADMAESFFLS